MTQRAPVKSATRWPQWVPFGALVSIEFLTVMDAAVVNIALPVIKEDFRYNHTGISWVVNSYLIAFAGLLLVAGRLADTFGRRRLFIAGTLVFTIGSAGSGMAVESWHLLTGRAVQGVGAALVVPAALALITDIFTDGPGRVRALGIFSSMGAVAAPIGLALGGFLTELDWHLIFWINVPLGLIVATIALTALPAPSPTPGQVDLLGAIAATGTMTLAALAAVSLEADGPSAINTIAAALAAVIFGLILTVRQRYAANPLIPPVLLRHRSIVIGNVIFVLVGSVLLGTFFFVTLYLQEVRGLAPLQATMAYVPIPLAVLAGTRLASSLIGRLGQRNALGLGLLAQAASLAIWAMVVDVNGSLAVTLVGPTFVWGVGLGISIVSAFVVCTSGVPGPVVGAASGLATAAYQGGGAVGLALVAALAAATGKPTNGSRIPTEAVQLDGYRWGIWALVCVAAAGAALTRGLMRLPESMAQDRKGGRSCPSTSSPR